MLMNREGKPSTKTNNNNTIARNHSSRIFVFFVVWRLLHPPNEHF